MERRKDTPGTGARLPRDYLKLIEDIFNKNFKPHRESTKKGAELFVSYGEIFPDELLLSISLKNPETLRMTTCYASIDWPLKISRAESGKQQATTAEAVEAGVSQCVDAIASFFATFFEQGRPIDYDDEFTQTWTRIEIDKATYVWMRINRDNTELEAQADAILAAASDQPKKKKKKDTLH